MTTWPAYSLRLDLPQDRLDDVEDYVSAFGPDVTDEKPFINIGAGDWRHPCWKNLDFVQPPYDTYTPPEYNIDLSILKPLPIEDSSIYLAFTSHTIEHLTDQMVIYWLREIRRTLKPGGVLRIVTPDIETAYWAYLLNDQRYYDQRYNGALKNETVIFRRSNGFASKYGSTARSFFARFASCYGNPSAISDLSGRTTDIDEALRAALSAYEFEYVLDAYLKEANFAAKKPSQHINWFNFEKLKRILTGVGFAHVVRTSYGQSVCPLMRNKAYFDTTRPNESIYVDAIVGGVDYLEEIARPGLQRSVPRTKAKSAPEVKPVKTEPAAFTSLPGKSRCPVCGDEAVGHRSDYPSLVEPFASKDVLYCSSCGSGHVPGSSALLETYYKAEYAATNRGDREIDPVTYFSDEYRSKTPKIAKYFERAQRHLTLLAACGAGFGRVADFGSGPGYLLYLSKAAEKVAFEPDLNSAKYLAHIGATRLDRVEQLLDHAFDAVVASHVLEHVVPEDLQKTVDILLKSLAPGGKLLIEVPHGGHTFARLTARQDPHTLFFTPEGIVRAVERAGGRVLFRQAMADLVEAPKETPVYTPKDIPFFKERRGALTLVCERRV